MFLIWWMIYTVNACPGSPKAKPVRQISPAVSPILPGEQITWPNPGEGPGGQGPPEIVEQDKPGPPGPHEPVHTKPPGPILPPGPEESMYTEPIITMPTTETTHAPKKVTLEKILFSNRPSSNGGNRQLKFKICTGKDEAKCCNSEDFFNKKGRALQYWFSKGCKGFKLISLTNKPFIETRFRTKTGKTKWNLECLELVMSDEYTQWVCRNITIVGTVSILSAPKCEWVHSTSYPCDF